VTLLIPAPVPATNDANHQRVNCGAPNGLRDSGGAGVASARLCSSRDSLARRRCERELPLRVQR
jgi:hypothetical protein